ncbi:hypothetical protein J4466_01475 [Candidatus Pacearchaeota archaeon]|nr:hypothetical protein [Candidatus Pacearchaeota archaeon]
MHGLRQRIAEHINTGPYAATDAEADNNYRDKNYINWERAGYALRDFFFAFNLKNQEKFLHEFTEARAKSISRESRDAESNWFQAQTELGRIIYLMYVAKQERVSEIKDLEAKLKEKKAYQES